MNDKNWKTELSQLLSPKKIAVVGATEKIGPARNTIKCLLDIGFEGDIYPIHPRYEQVFGIDCYKNLFELPEKPDLVIVAVRAELVVDIIKQCEQLGINAVTIYSSGFSEVGPEGKKLQDEIAEIANRAKIRICGPNCLGHLDVINKTGAYSASVFKDTKPGGIAIISQSGSMAISMYQAFKNLGVSHIISYGNQAVLDLSDYLFYLSNDPNTKVITTFIEGVNDGERFIMAAKECRKNKKPIIALKIGKSEISKKIAISHTAAIVGSHKVYAEVFKETGILQVEDIDEMLQTVTALIKTPPLEKNGVAIVAISGGQCGIVGDISEKIGLNLVEFSPNTKNEIEKIVPPYVNVSNPLDVSLVGSDNYKDYADVLRCCLEDENVGIVAVMQDAPLGAGYSTVDHYSKIAKAVIEVFKETSKPIILFTNHSTPYEPKIMEGLIDLGVPFLQGTKEALLSIKHLIDHYVVNKDIDKEVIDKELDIESAYNWNQIRNMLLEHKRNKQCLGERESKELLSALNIPVTNDILCKSVNDVRESLKKFTGKVALKIDSPDIHHKTDVGGVVLGLRSEDEVVNSYTQILEAVRNNKPKARINGVIMQEMVPDGVDLIIGAKKDEQFGPIVAFGLGGIYAEVFCDSSIGLVPFGREKAREMIRTSKSYRLLKEVRGRKALDIELIVNILISISLLMKNCGDLIEEIDLNPVRIGVFGVKVLDALINFEK